MPQHKCWKSKDSCWKWVLSSHHVDPGDQSQVIGLGSLYLQSYLVDPSFIHSFILRQGLMYHSLNSDVYVARSHLGLLSPSLYSQVLGLPVYATIPSYLSLVLFETGYHRVS